MSIKLTSSKTEAAEEAEAIAKALLVIMTRTIQLWYHLIPPGILLL